MKVLMINGSPRKEGNTALALAEMEKIFTARGIEVEIIQIGGEIIRGCIGCSYCYKNGKCVTDDLVNEVAEKLREADGFVVGSPVYYSSPNGTLISFLDRLFYSSKFPKNMKVGAAVCAARRGGLATTFDVLNKYFSISGMPIASSSYWNDVHGRKVGDAANDLEGMQTMRNLAENMAFLMKSIALGKEKFGIPEMEKKIYTNL